MYGTRAHIVVDLTFTIVLLTPIAIWIAIRAARRRAYLWHRNAQLVILSMCIAAVLALELSIRAAGGSGSLVAGSPYAGTPTLRWIAIFHVSGAVLTYAVWIWTATTGWRRFRTRLPGSFSRRHRRVGWSVFGGLIYTSISAAAMYWLGFVA